MKDTVYDTEVIARANRHIHKGVISGNLSHRLDLITECVTGKRIALYNNTLRYEYTTIIKEHRNDIIDLFIRGLTDYGKPCRNTLSRQDYHRAKPIRWPAHDRHLLAAATDGIDTTIFVVEPRLHNCAEKVLRIFGFRVIKV